MHYDLDLAIAYACVLGLFCWLASWFVPLALSTLFRATVAWLDAHARRRRQGTPPGGLTTRSSESDWFGPVHHSH